MGAGQSTILDTSTEQLKERVGLFALRGSQKQFLEGLSVFLRLILSQNTLFDLQPVLTNPEKCHEFYVVLSSLLKKEFRVLRLPDASTRGATHKVPWMTKKQYEQLESEPLRKNVCNDIAWFILRYTTLIVALTASVKINPEMPAVLERASAVAGTVTQNKAFKNPAVTPQLETAISFSPALAPEVLNGLLSGTLRHVKIAGEDTPDVRPLYVFEGQERIVLNAQHGYLYAPQRSVTVLFSIELTPVIQNSGVQMQRSSPYPTAPVGYLAPVAPVAPVAPAAPMAPAVLAAPMAPAPAVLAAPMAPAPVAPAALAAPMPPMAPRPQFIRPQNNANRFSVGQQTATTATTTSGLTGGHKSRRNRNNRRGTRRAQRILRRWLRGHNATPHMREHGGCDGVIVGGGERRGATHKLEDHAP